MRSVPCGPSLSSSTVVMKPSSARICATAFFILEAGMSTVWWLAVFALRMRVSRSAIGSVVTDIFYSLPRRLGDAGDEAAMRVLAEANAAHGELAQVSARTPADAAAVVSAHRELRLQLGFFDRTGLSH